MLKLCARDQNVSIRFLISGADLNALSCLNLYIAERTRKSRKIQNPLLSNHGRYGRIKRLIKITSADSDGGA